MSFEASAPRAVVIGLLAVAAAVAVAAVTTKTTQVAGTWTPPANGHVDAVAPAPPAALHAGEDVVVTGSVAESGDPVVDVDAVVDGAQTDRGVARLGAATSRAGERAFTARITTRGLASGEHRASLWVRTRSGRYAPIPAAVAFVVGT